MNRINIQYYKTNYGEFILGTYDRKLCMIDFRYRKMRKTVDDRIKKGLNAEFIEHDDEILQKTRLQLNEYFRAVANANGAMLLVSHYPLSSYHRNQWRTDRLCRRVAFEKTTLGIRTKFIYYLIHFSGN